MGERTNVGIISIGEMGLGIANLLISHGYNVVTNISGRSQHTLDRAKSANITLLASDLDLFNTADYILSIVPPKDALATAQRIADAAAASLAAGPEDPSAPRRPAGQPLYYLDLNAIAPSSALGIARVLEHASLQDAIRLIDGGIIGGPPARKPASNGTTIPSTSTSSDDAAWSVPSIVLSGPTPLSASSPAGAHLARLLNTKHLSPQFGDASGLKCCFAALSKGFTALAIQSFSTAHQLGVLDALRAELRGTAGGGGGGAAALSNEARAVRGLVGMPHKSGRWVAEMQEIGRAFREVGGWTAAGAAAGTGAGEDGEDDVGGGVFDEIAEVYRYVAEETVLGEEKSGQRVRGTTAEDVVAAILESRDKQ